MLERLEGETGVEYAALRVYVGTTLDEQPTYMDTSKRYKDDKGKSYSAGTIGRWGAKNRWVERRDNYWLEVESRVSTEMGKQVIKEIIDERQDNIQILSNIYNKLLHNFDSGIDAGKINVETHQDIRAALDLMRAVESSLDNNGYNILGIEKKEEIVESRTIYNKSTIKTLYQVKKSVEVLIESGEIGHAEYMSFKGILNDEMEYMLEGYSYKDIPLLSKRQLETIRDFGEIASGIDYGPMGVGKTYAELLGLGVLLFKIRPPADALQVVLAGRTVKMVKDSICNQLTALFGGNFNYDTSKKDGKSKDATFAGHSIKFVGMNDVGAEQRIRGCNAYIIFGDELSTWTREHYSLLAARLREVKVPGLRFNINRYATNPDSPGHWLKKMMDSDIASGASKVYTKWEMADNITPGAEAYYEKLKEEYRDEPAFFSRYIMGEFAAAEGLVFKSFNEDRNTISEEAYKVVQAQGTELLETVIGADWGNRNATSLVVIEKYRGGAQIVLEAYEMPETTTLKVINKVRDIRNRYNISKIIVDPSAAAFKDRLEEEGITEYVNAENSVKYGNTKVNDAFREGKLFIHEDCKRLIETMYSYRYKDDGTDKVHEVDDHLPDGLRYGVVGERI